MPLYLKSAIGEKEGDGHLAFPVILEGGEGDVEERTHEVAPVSAAKIEYCGSDGNTQFLDFLGGLTSIRTIAETTFFTLASSRQSVGRPID